MLDDMLAHFSHGLADSGVVVEQLAVSPSVPLGEGGELLRNGVEEPDNDADGHRLHVATELLDSDRVGNAVVAVELNLLPDGEEDGGEHEDGGPVLQALTAVDARVERRKLLQDVLLQLAPHVGHGAFDLEVDHDGGDHLAVVLGVLVVDLTFERLFCWRLLDHGDMEGEVVGHDELERLADDQEPLPVLGVESIRRLEDVGDERRPFKVVINELLKALVNVLVEVLVQSLHRNTLLANIEPLRADLEVNGLLILQGRLNPVNLEAALVGNVDLADHDREAEAVTVRDPHQRLLLRETLDVEDRHAAAEMALVVGLPVLHEIANVLDVNAGARNLPQASMRRLAASARLALIARLLEELAAEAGPEFPDLAGLLALLRKQGAAPPAHLLLAGAILLARRRPPDDRFCGLGDGALSRSRVPSRRRRG